MNKLLRLRIIEIWDNQANFAQELGVSDSIVSGVVRGRRRLSPEMQDMWAQKLQSTPEALGLREYHK